MHSSFERWAKLKINMGMTGGVAPRSFPSGIYYLHILS